MAEEQDLIELEEEEHTSQLTAPVFRRILTLLKPHWKWVLGFLITIALTSSLDAYFTYLNKQIVDTGITLGDKERVMELAVIYGVFQVMQAGFVFTFIYLAGVLGERVQYDLRKMLFNHLQARCQSCLDPASRGCCCTRPSATAWKPTSTARTFPHTAR